MDVAEAVDDTCTSLSLAALLGTECHLLETGQVTQLGSVKEGEKTVYLKLPVLREQRRSGAVRCNKKQQKGLVLSNPHPENSPRPLSAPAAGMHSEDILIQLVPVVLNSRV